MKPTRNQWSDRQHRLRDLFNRKQHIEQQVSGHGDPMQALESDKAVRQEYAEILKELEKLL